MRTEDIHFLRKAIDLALEGMRNNTGGPFGAVVVKNGQIIGAGSNKVTSSNDPTAHAEVVAIRNACQQLQDYQLTDCTIYSSCEPCPMCLGAIYWARPARIVFAASHSDAAHIAGFDDSLIYRELALPYDDRAIETLQILKEEGKLPFQEWAAKVDKKRY